jgi:hypothetical protein
MWSLEYVTIKLYNISVILKWNYVALKVSYFSVQVSFAEQVLPLLVCLVLSTGSEVCKDIMNRSICSFFRSHFETCLQLDKGRSSSPLPVLKREFSVLVLYVR